MKFFFMNANEGTKKERKIGIHKASTMRDRIGTRRWTKEKALGTLRRKDRSREGEDSRRDCGNREQNMELLCRNKM